MDTNAIILSQKKETSRIHAQVYVPTGNSTSLLQTHVVYVISRLPQFQSESSSDIPCDYHGINVFGINAKFNHSLEPVTDDEEGIWSQVNTLRSMGLWETSVLMIATWAGNFWDGILYPCTLVLVLFSAIRLKPP